MTHKPKINKYLWLSAGKSWRFTTSTRHKLVVLFVFALCILPANLCGQSLAIKSNLLYDLTTSLNLGGEIRCDDTHTFSLSVNYKFTTPYTILGECSLGDSEMGKCWA